ncbi:MAG: pyridoxal phosphate-dependent aminotransferase [Fimbriimonadaceae bacterium]
MPKLSHRADLMPASPIRKLAPYATAAKAKGTHVYHLNIGQPDIASPQEFWDAVRGTDRTYLEYSPSEGMADVREKLAEHYAARGIELAPNQIMVTTAGSEALSFAVLSCLNPGDEVIVPEPMYANYLGFSVAAGVMVMPLTTRIEDDFALPPVEEFAKKITDRTRAILICNPNNPTGTVYSEDQLEGLSKLCLEHDLYLIADEVYRDFNYSGKPVKSVMQLEGMEKHAIAVDSTSKKFSLCGARVGFLLTRNMDVQAAALKFAQARLAPPTLEQVGLLGALQASDQYFEDVRTEYVARRDMMVERLRAMPGVLCPDIQGAFYATVRLPVDDADKFAQWMLESFEHDGATVMMAPASGFYETKTMGRDEVRIAYVLKREDLGKAMDCLEAGLAKYPGRKAESAAH